MPSLNHTKFPGKVRSGEKLTTIRALRKRLIRKGDRLYHYSGMRTKRCRLLRVTTCVDVCTILILRPRGSFGRYQVILNGRNLPDQAIRAIAAMDGFRFCSDFIEYFCPPGCKEAFFGQWIMWS